MGFFEICIWRIDLNIDFALLKSILGEYKNIIKFLSFTWNSDT